MIISEWLIQRQSDIWDSVGFANIHIGLSKFNDLDLTKFQAQDFDVIQDWRRTTLKKHHHTPARLSSPTINTGASTQKYYSIYLKPGCFCVLVKLNLISKNVCHCYCFFQVKRTRFEWTRLRPEKEPCLSTSGQLDKKFVTLSRY